ncbi:MAG: thioredoxin [Bacteroidia bacterium]|jgi:thioredoxin 1
MDKSSSFQELINGSKPVLVDFFAEWCGPCKMMAPILSQLKSELGDTATIIKIDIDRNQNAAAAFRVQSVPTLILFKEGKVLWRESGVVSAAQLKTIIHNHS